MSVIPSIQTRADRGQPRTVAAPNPHWHIVISKVMPCPTSPSPLSIGAARHRRRNPPAAQPDRASATVWVASSPP